MKYKKIFITGGTGFVGSNLVRKLLKEGAEVFALARKNSDFSNLEDVLGGIRICYGSLSDAAGLENIFRKIRPQVIYHLAASNIRSGVTAPLEEVIKTNFTGTANLINASLDIGYSAFINTGSFLEYGSKRSTVKESDLTNPPEIYSITKLAGTLYAQAVGRSKQKPIVTFRPFTPYGPYIQKGRLIHEVIARALRNETIELSNPKVTKDFIFVEDLCDLYIEASERAVEKKGEIFNLGSGRAVRFDELVGATEAILGAPLKINWGAFNEVAYDSGIWEADMTKTFANFNWRPRYSLPDGLAKTIEHFKRSNLA